MIKNSILSKQVGKCIHLISGILVCKISGTFCVSVYRNNSGTSVYLCRFQIYLIVFILLIRLVCMPVYLLSSDYLNLLATDFDAFEVA